MGSGASREVTVPITPRGELERAHNHVSAIDTAEESRRREVEHAYREV